VGRGIEKDSLNTYGNATGQSANAYGTLAPQLNSMVTNPMGYTPTQKANMLTSSSQSIGGSVAGAVGEGNLEAARTNNAGGYSAALDASARQGQVQNSVNALGVQNADAQLAHQNQLFGLHGLDDIYHGANSTALGALGQATNASNNTNANTMGWTKMGLNLLGTPGQFAGVGIG